MTPALPGVLIDPWISQFPNRASLRMSRPKEHSAGDVIAGDEVPGRTLEADLPLLQENGSLANLGGDIQALFDHDHGHTGGMDAPHHLDELANDNRRQTQRHLISMHNTLGSSRRALATASCCCSPPDRFPAFCR